jgi:phytoene desaturase
VTGKKQRVGVVGGGLGGLSAATTLAARGHDVVLFERNAWLGGKAAVLEEQGFRFDMGPTILTVPSVLEKIWQEAGRSLDRDLALIRLDPQWRCFFEGGSVLDLREDVAAMAAAIASFAPDKRSAEGYRRFMTYSERLHGISDRYFFWRPIGSLLDMFSAREALRAGTLADVLALKAGATVAGTVRAHVPDPRVAQLLDHFVQYIGSSPYNAPAVLCGIASMQTNEGIWYPRGGTAAVPRALEKLGRELGVTYRTETGVSRLEVEHGTVRAIVTDTGERVPVDAVVSNMDSVLTHRELLDSRAGRAFLKRRRYEPACSGVVLYLGLSRAYDHIAHHNFVFSRDPEEEFEAIYGKGEPAPDPTCYVAATARTEPGTAPAGGEALYVLVHTPYLRPGHDWTRMLPAYRETIVRKLERTMGLKDLRARIVMERALTPADIRDRYKTLDGAIYGLASHGRFLGAFKPSNRSDDVHGLYLAGGAAHPGPGMPMVLMSGWIAADALHKDLATA